MKTCNKCKKEKRTSEFGTFVQREKTYTRGQCNTCRSESESNKRIKNPEVFKERDKKKYNKDKQNKNYKLYHKEQHLKRKYGLTLEAFNSLLKGQENKCKICKTKDPFPHWAVDHNHKTKEIRGILCGNCNSAIGLLGDSPKILKEAAKYLEESGYYGS